MTASLRSAVLTLVGAALAVLCLAAPAAYGHGDPSAHYLESGALYPAFANPPSQSVELELLGLLAAAEDAGYPIKVALVGAEDDVSDTPEMLRQPQRYAEQLQADLEAERPLRAPLLVVTPHGFGVSGRLGAVERGDAGAVVRGVELAAHPDGDALARAAMVAVRQIARAGGHPLPAHVPPATALSPGPDRGTGSMAGWLPFGVFAVVFLLAWLGFEIRTRAARRRDGVAAADPAA